VNWAELVLVDFYFSDVNVLNYWTSIWTRCQN